MTGRDDRVLQCLGQVKVWAEVSDKTLVIALHHADGKLAARADLGAEDLDRLIDLLHQLRQNIAPIVPPPGGNLVV